MLCEVGTDMKRGPNECFWETAQPSSTDRLCVAMCKILHVLEACLVIRQEFWFLSRDANTP